MARTPDALYDEEDEGERRPAPLHAPLLQARRRGLDRRPPAADLRRRLGRLDGAGSADGRRLREHVPDVVARRRVDRLRLGARGRLGHEARLRPVRGRGRRRRPGQDHGLGRTVRLPRLVARRRADRVLLRPGHLRRPAARAARGRAGKGGELRLLSASLDRNCFPYPPIRPPAWDGDSIVFAVEDAGNNDLYRVAARRLGTDGRAAGTGRDRLRRGRRRPRLHGLDADDLLRAVPGRRAGDAADRGVHLATGAGRAGAVRRGLQGRLGGRGVDHATRRVRGRRALSRPPQHPRRAVHAVHDQVLRRVPRARRRRLRGRLLEPARLVRLQRGVGTRDPRARTEAGRAGAASTTRT